jgi:hypothetical protein
MAGYVTLYEHDDYGGYALTFYGGSSDLTQYGFNDVTSSIITDDTTVLFEDVNYSGDYWVIPAGYFNLDDLEAYGVPNDTISSFYTV